MTIAKHWNEIRTAAVVAKLGTVSAAARALEIHRATVARHIDTLEALFSAKLFQRHPKGFTPTELGAELLRIAEVTDAQFGELQRLAKGHTDTLSGELTVTSVDVLVPMLLPSLNAFRIKYPRVRIHMLSSDSVLKLEYGEADVAFRIGPKPREPDNVVIPYTTVEMGLYAAASYADRHGVPRSPDEYRQHYFVGPDALAPARTPFLEWITTTIPSECVGFTSNSIAVLWAAVLSGSGLGFLPTALAKEREDLITVLAPQPEWNETLWIVTHVDLHRSIKVQAFLSLLRQSGCQIGSEGS